MWFRNRDVNNVEKNGFRHSQCAVSKQHFGLYVESKHTNVESKLLLQLLLCGFNICLFLLDQTAKIDPTELLTCQGSFGGFESTCFQLDRAARIKTTKISYFSCDRTLSLNLLSRTPQGKKISKKKQDDGLMPMVTALPFTWRNRQVTQPNQD